MNLYFSRKRQNYTMSKWSFFKINKFWYRQTKSYTVDKISLLSLITSIILTTNVACQTFWDLQQSKSWRFTWYIWSETGTFLHISCGTPFYTYDTACHLLTRSEIFFFIRTFLLFNINNEHFLAYPISIPTSSCFFLFFFNILNTLHPLSLLWREKRLSSWYYIWNEIQAWCMEDGNRYLFSTKITVCSWLKMTWLKTMETICCGSEIISYQMNYPIEQTCRKHKSIVSGY